MTSTLEVLNTIYEQIKNKDEWHQGALFSKDGNKLCIAGRLYSVNDLDKKESVRQRLYQALAEMNFPPELADYNDTHTHAEVVQLVVRAIAIERRAINSVSKITAMA